MKTPACFLLIALFAGITVFAQAQRRSRERLRDTAPRELKVMIRDSLGNTFPDVDITALVKGEGRLVLPRTDRSGNRYYRTSGDDTLCLLLLGKLYVVPPPMDSLLVIRPLRADPVNRIDPVTVTGRAGEKIDIGYGSVSRDNYAGFGTVVDMSWAKHSSDLLTYLEGRMGPGIVIRNGMAYQSGNTGLVTGSPPMLLVVDGVPFDGDLRELSSMYPLRKIASVVVDRMGTIYGSRAIGGALIISTKD